MIALTKSELVKLRSTRVLGWLLVGTLAMEVVTIFATVPSSGVTADGLSLEDPALLARLVGLGILWPQLAVVLIGVLAYSQEVRYGTISSTLLVEPRRRRVLAAKGAAVVVVSAAITIGACIVTIVASVALIRARHGNASLEAEFWQVVAAALVVMALSGIIGLAVGALVRNQIVAVTAVLIWLTAGEHLLLEALPQVARWTPGGATDALLQLGATATTTGTLLDAPIGGVFLVGYTAIAAAAALIVTPRRDIA